MKKTYYFFAILQIVFAVSISKAQHKLQPAFPNLTGFEFPVELVNAYDGTNRMFVVEQKGKIQVFNNSPSVSTKKTFIDLSSIIDYVPYLTGLLGLTFHPNYENNRYFYVHYVFDSTGGPTGKWIRVSRFTASPTNPDSALISSKVNIITTYITGAAYHVGGKVAFGPDGYLYISFGEGLAAGSASHAQFKTDLLGKVLRINVDAASGGNNYSSPPTNPFYGNSQGFRQEIYAYGFRNLWKFSIDPVTNRIWGGDVGENIYEEINLIENGKNYGWDKMEGFHCYPPNSCDTTGKGFTRPILEYPHSVGHAVIGGYVYRGSQIPDLYGKYIYSDEFASTIWTLTYDGINPPVNTQLLDTNLSIVSFGVDQNEELYILEHSETNGKIYKLIYDNNITLNSRILIEGFYNTSTGKLNMRDTITAYLRGISSPFTIVDSSKAVIDSVSFTCSFKYVNTPSGTYYIQLAHRNALETWSRSGGQNFNQGQIVTYNFISDSARAFGNNMKKIGSSWSLYSGDVAKEGFIDLTDVIAVHNDALSFITGYVETDVNGNSIVDQTDVVLAYNNSIRFVGKKAPLNP